MGMSRYGRSNQVYPSPFLSLCPLPALLPDSHPAGSEGNQRHMADRRNDVPRSVADSGQRPFVGVCVYAFKKQLWRSAFPVEAFSMLEAMQALALAHKPSAKRSRPTGRLPCFKRFLGMRMRLNEQSAAFGSFKCRRHAKRNYQL